MLHTIKQFIQKPSLYQKSEARFWDDPYISQRMLEAHLNPDLESATRKLEFVRQSVDWISNILPPAQYDSNASNLVWGMGFVPLSACLVSLLATGSHYSTPSWLRFFKLHAEAMWQQVS